MVFAFNAQESKTQIMFYCEKHRNQRKYIGLNVKTTLELHKKLIFDIGFRIHPIGINEKAIVLLRKKHRNQRQYSGFNVKRLRINNKNNGFIVVLAFNP